MIGRTLLSRRMHAAVVIARRQVTETLLSPGPYVALAAGMLIAFFLSTGFVNAIDSSGFDPRLSPVWSFAVRALAGGFGPTFLERLLSEGPFLAALVISCAPVLLYLCVASVFRFGQEKSAGAVELLVYGPADGTSYLLATFFKDAALSACTVVFLALYFLALSMLENLALGPMFYTALPVVCLLSVALCAYGVLCSVAAENGASAFALFTGIVAVFTVLQIGSSIVEGPGVRAAAETVSAVIQWFSPLYYASLCARSFDGGNILEFLAGLALLPVLACAALAAAHLLIRRKGVRS